MAKSSRIGRLLREPLLHFALLGFTVFLAYGWLGGAPAGEGDRIIITRGRIAQIVASYERASQRTPLAEELEGLVEDAVREEILYREAMAMGLDKDDTIVRRRLRQKLEFVSEDVEPIPEPTDAQLQAYLRVHADLYRAEPRYDVSHVYVDPRKHGAQLAADAATMLGALRRDSATNAGAHGDAFLLPGRFRDIGAAELARLFGPEFAGSLRTLPTGAWQGPVGSGYGAHLVFLHRRDDSRAATLADVRDALRERWMADQRMQANARFYAGLRKRYDVTIEGGPQANHPTRVRRALATDGAP